MRWYGKLLIFLSIFLLIAGTGGMVFLLRSRSQANEYLFQIDAILAASSVANGGEADPSPDKAVIAEYDGRRSVIVPGNYRALSSYLRKDAVMPLWAGLDRKTALKITFCNASVLYASPLDASGDKLLVQLDTQDHIFTMHIRGGNLWFSLLKCCLEGTYHDQNLPLD